ncbi:MAG: TIGR02530 family flagellar biosynthesis protein [Calditrichia bacterium]
MPGKIDGMKPPFVPIGGLEGIPSRRPVVPESGGSDFKKLLLEKMAEERRIKFSAHARTRLESRNIEMSPDDLSKLSDAMDRASGKGAHDSLILMREAAFIVNLDNRTVITAVDDAGLKENIFTNIDSAVVVD